jgi:hypothetical protein
MTDRAAVERALVRGGVDPAGEARDDDEVSGGEFGAQFAGEADRRRARIARPDHRHARPFEKPEVALDRERGRRGFELGEQPRVKVGADEDEAPAELRHRRHLGFGGGGDAWRAAAAADEVGERGKRGWRAAEAAKQLAVGDGTDIAAADQPQAGDVDAHLARSPPRSSSGGPPLWPSGIPSPVGKTLAPIRLSVPARRRRMLSPWRKIKRNAIATKTISQKGAPGGTHAASVARPAASSTGAAIDASMPPTDE